MRTAGIVFGAILLAAVIFVPVVHANNTNISPNVTPFISIDPIDNHTFGDVFFINGSTNLPASENITLTFVNLADISHPHTKSDTSAFSSGWKTLPDIPLSPLGDGLYRWSTNVTGFALRNMTGFHCKIKIQYSLNDTRCDISGDQWMVMASHKSDIPLNFDTSTKFFLFPAAIGPARVPPGPVLLWSAPTGSTESMSGNAAKVACSGDGNYVAAGYGAGIVEFRDRPGAILWRWQSPRSDYTVGQVAVSRNGEYAGVILYEPLHDTMGEVDYFDRAGNLLWNKSLQGPFGWITLSGDGNTVALADRDRISLFNATGHLLGTTVLASFPWSIAISGDGSTGVAGVSSWSRGPGSLNVIGTNGSVYWSVPAGRVESVAVSEDGSSIALAESSRLRYFTREGRSLWMFNSTPEFSGVAVSATGSYIAASSQYFLRYFNSSGSMLWQYEVPIFQTKPGPRVGHLQMSGDGGHLSVSTDSNLTLFFNRVGKLLWQHQSPSWIRSTSLSRDGKYLAIGTEQEFRYFDTGIDVPIAASEPTVVTTIATRAPAPSQTPQASVQGLVTVIGLFSSGLLWRRVTQKK